MTNTVADTTFDTGPKPLVYIRPMEADEASALLPPNALEAIDDTRDLFIVFDADGQHLAIVEGREEAFAAAEAYDLTPLSVH